jgi:hypothetical protein
MLLHLSLGIWLTETDRFSSRFFSKFGFLIIETEISPPKGETGHLVNRQIRFGFRLNRSSYITHTNVIVYLM